MGGAGGDMMGRGMMGGGMMGRGMMGGGAMGPPIMLRMMFALMDSDGDGTISLPEFQAAHERIFKAMDSNKDGRLTPGGDASVHARDQEIGSAAVGRPVDLFQPAQLCRADAWLDRAGRTRGIDLAQCRGPRGRAIRCISRNSI